MNHLKYDFVEDKPALLVFWNESPVVIMYLGSFNCTFPDIYRIWCSAMDHLYPNIMILVHALPQLLHYSIGLNIKKPVILNL